MALTERAPLMSATRWRLLRA
uniref:Uncharacterized protein n=1 Tax=Arundo donax TaxID=35708 RepID=A0A0A9AHG3_ARUDO